MAIELEGGCRVSTRTKATDDEWLDEDLNQTPINWGQSNFTAGP